jgi:hypothetical protein
MRNNTKKREKKREEKRGQRSKLQGLFYKKIFTKNPQK